MDACDVFIVGGGIAGSIAAKFAAAGGLETVLIEKKKTPRSKACSGIQFGYLEKIMGEKIPRDKLCTHQLERMSIQLPDGRTITAPFKMFNFMRKPFDDWLNSVARASGAVFKDQCEYVDHEIVNGSFIVTIKAGDVVDRVKAKYLVDASGLMPAIRRRVRPQNFQKTCTGGTLNYYIDGTVDMDEKTLYQFWNIEFSNAMFAWVYTKTLDGGKECWVVGTGCNGAGIKERQEKFYAHVKEKFGMAGEIIKKEGYASTIDMRSKDRVWLGEGNLLMVGDAAGLVDMVRGVGMDAAALSGRLVAKAILAAERNGTGAIAEYTRLMRAVVDQTRSNQQREIAGFTSNDELQAHMDKSVMKMGLGLVVQSALNALRPAERQKLLPP